MKEKRNIDTLLRYANELEDFIFGKVDVNTLLRTEGFGARPTQQDKSEFVAAYGRKINIVQMAVNKIKENMANGITVSEKEQQLVQILDKINKEHPAQRRREIHDIAINFDREIRGIVNNTTGIREGGLNKRPSNNSSNPREKELGIDLIIIQKAVKRIKQKEVDGKIITEQEMEIIKIYEDFCRDYPKLVETKSFLENAQDVITYIQGNDEKTGIKRRPRENSDNPVEKNMANKLHFLEKKASRLKEESKSRALLDEEKLLIELLSKLDLEFPKKNRNASMLDSIRLLDKYIRGGYDEVTGTDFPGIKRRPNEIIARSDATEKKFFKYFENGFQKAKKIMSEERQLSFDELELVEIMTSLCRDYPKKNADIETAVKILIGYIYDGIEKKDGTIIEAIHKRPAVTSKDILERKMANKLISIRNKVTELAKNEIPYEELSDGELMGVEFLHQLDIDYPSQKKTRTEALKYCDRILEKKAESQKNEKTEETSNNIKENVTLVNVDSEDPDARDR